MEQFQIICNDCSTADGMLSFTNITETSHPREQQESRIDSRKYYPVITLIDSQLRCQAKIALLRDRL